MPGHLEKRSDKSWTIVIDVGKDPSTGKRKRIKRAFQGGKREAEKEMARLLTELESGLMVDPSAMKVSDYLKQWFDTAKDNLAPTTQVRYKLIINRLIEYLGQLELQKLKPMHVQQMYSKLFSDRRDGKQHDGKDKLLSPATVLYHHRVLHKALESAVKWQLVPRNVADAVDPPKLPKQIVTALDDDNVVYLFEKAKDTPYLALLVVAVMTGMRRGEIMGLKWEDIDFDNQKIYVQRTLQYIPKQGLIFKEPKTAGSRRSVSMTPFVQEVLRKHRKKQLEDKFAAGPLWEEHGMVFCQANGKPMHPDTPTSWFPAFCEQIKLPKVKFHSLRHTCASLLLKQGVHSKIVADILGHSSTRITDDIYSHVLPGVQEDALAKLDNLIGAQQGTKDDKKASR